MSTIIPPLLSAEELLRTQRENVARRDALVAKVLPLYLEWLRDCVAKALDALRVNTITSFVWAPPSDSNGECSQLCGYNSEVLHKARLKAVPMLRRELIDLGYKVEPIRSDRWDLKISWNND